MIATGIFMALAGIFNAAMDVASFYWHESVFNNGNEKFAHFTNPKMSWMNKYKDFDPEKGPKFPGSTTIFVWTTDLWHLCKSLMLLCFAFAILFYTPASLTSWTLVDFAINLTIIKLCFGSMFTLFMRVLHNKKPK